MAKKFALELTLEALDKVSAPLVRMQRRMTAALGPVMQVGRGIRQVGIESGRAVRDMALLGAGVATAVGALVHSYTQAGDTAAKQAQRIGIGVEPLQELRFAAQRAGIEAEDLDQGLLVLTRSLGQLKLGTGALNSMLSRSAPLLRAQLEAASDPAEAFEILADAMAATEDATLRAALASAAFGRGGLRMITLLKDGRAEIAKVRAEARALGVVIGEKGARDAEAMSDALDNLRAAATGLRNVVGGALLPALQPLVEQLTTMVVRLRPHIERWARDFAANLPQRFEQLRAGAIALWQELQPLVRFVQALVERFGLANVVGGALALKIGGPLLASIVALTADIALLVPWVLKLAVTTRGLLLPALAAATKAVIALGAAILATPVGWIIAGIAALVAVGWVLYENWDSIAKGLRSAWGWVVDLLEKAWSIIKKITGAGVDAAAGAADWLTRPHDATVDTGRAAFAGASDFDAAYQAGAARRGGGEARVRVDFANLPSGASVRTEGAAGVGVQTRVGHSFQGP